jgi:hypothetical protein
MFQDVPLPVMPTPASAPALLRRQSLGKRFLTWLLLESGETIIRIKSIVPQMSERGIEWPVLLIETRGGRRMNVVPLWDRARLRVLFGVNPDVR